MILNIEFYLLVPSYFLHLQLTNAPNFGPMSNSHESSNLRVISLKTFPFSLLAQASHWDSGNDTKLLFCVSVRGHFPPREQPA